MQEVGAYLNLKHGLHSVFVFHCRINNAVLPFICTKIWMFDTWFI